MDTPVEQLAEMPYDQAIDTIMRESILPLARQDAEEIYRYTVAGPDIVAVDHDDK